MMAVSLQNCGGEDCEFSMQVLVEHDVDVRLEGFTLSRGVF